LQPDTLVLFSEHYEQLSKVKVKKPVRRRLAPAALSRRKHSNSTAPALLHSSWRITLANVAEQQNQGLHRLES